MQKPKRIIALSVILIFLSVLGVGSNIFLVITNESPQGLGIFSPEVTIATNIIGGLITICCAIFFLKGVNIARIVYSIYLLITSLVSVYASVKMELPAELTNLADPQVYKITSIAFILVMMTIPFVILYSGKSNKFFNRSNIQAANNLVSEAE